MNHKERIETLATINAMSNVLDTVTECQDMWLSDVRKLQRALNQLSDMVDVAPQKSDDGDRPNHCRPMVLTEDETAWHWKKPE